MKNNKIFFLIITAVGLFIYFNSLLNMFALDDMWQIKYNTKVTSPQNIFSFFVGSTFGQIDNFKDPLQLYYYYKPFLTLSFSLIYSLFGATAFYFHFFQLSLHIINAFLIFIIFCRFFSKKLSLFLALIFLSHPINVESVVYISAMQEPLFLFFGLLSIFYTIRNIIANDKTSKKHLLLIYFLLLFSILSKESGILFLAIIPIYTLIFQKKIFISYFFISFLAFISYLYLRIIIGKMYTTHIFVIPITQVDLFTRIINIPKIIEFYLQTFIFPANLSFTHVWVIKNPTLQDFYIPFFLISLFFLSVLWLGIITWKKNRYLFKPYLFFLIWFLVGLGLHLHLFPFLDATATDRWFYFPIIGLLGIIGIASSSISIKRHKIKHFIMFSAVIILILLSLRTIMRNFDWHNTYTLISHDIKIDKSNYYLEDIFGLELFSQKKYNEAKNAFVKSNYLYSNPSALSNLGIVYMQENNFIKAEEYLYKSLAKLEALSTYQNLAFVLLKNHKPKEAKAIIEKALKLSPDNGQFWILLMFAEYNIGNIQKATDAAFKAYTFSPNPATQASYEKLKNNLPINNYFK